MILHIHYHEIIRYFGVIWFTTNNITILKFSHKTAHHDDDDDDDDDDNNNENELTNQKMFLLITHLNNQITHIRSILNHHQYHYNLAIKPLTSDQSSSLISNHHQFFDFSIIIIIIIIMNKLKDVWIIGEFMKNINFIFIFIAYFLKEGGGRVTANFITMR